MANVHGDLFSDIKKRMLDWITESNTDNNVTDLCLDYLNQAQKELRFAALWQELLVIYPLTVTSKVASLPSDIGEIMRVYYPDDNGKPVMQYYNSPIYSSNGYREVNSGDKDSGYTKTLQFYADPVNNVTLDYYKTLEDFDGGDTAEYSWFPGTLLRRKAQLMYLEEEGLSPTSEYAKIENGLENALTDFKRGHLHRNYDLRMVQRDNLGNVITFDNYNLEDGEGESDYFNTFSNSTDTRRIHGGL